MADEPNTPTPAAGSPQVVDAGGGTIRVTPDTSTGSDGPTLEEQDEAQRKATGGGEEAPKAGEGEQPKSAETPPGETPKEGEEGKPPEVPAEFDLKGTVFDGLSDDMQGKIKPFAFAYSQNGTLTDAEVVEAAKATGFSEAAVRQFMAGADVSAEANAKPIFEAAGGEAQYREFQAWTQEAGNLTPSEERTINKALQTGDVETAQQLMGPAMERWKSAGGAAPARDVTSGRAGGAGPSGQAEAGYDNWAQVQKDMGNPQYQSDAAFRKTVEQKLARSPKLG